MADRSTGSNPPTNGNGREELQSSRWGLSHVKDLIVNYITTRVNMLRRWADPRRDMEYECGHPPLGSIVEVSLYQNLFEREPIPARVVELYPKECFQVTPTVYEDEDPETVTAWEEAWDGLGAQISGGGYRTEEKGSRIWDILRRADIHSGIGSYGVILIGIDDGLDLSQPALLRERKEPKRGKPRRKGKPAPTPEEPPATDDNPARVDAEIEPATKTANDAGTGTGTDTDLTGNAWLGEIPVSTALPDERPYVRDPKTGELVLPGKRSPLDAPPPKKGKGNGVTRRLRYLQVFSEFHCRVAEWEADDRSDRFGLPTMYTITFGGAQNVNGPAMPVVQKNVHWTRVLHVAEDLEYNAIAAAPRMRAVLNRLLDCRKILGPAAEGFYKNGIAGWAFQTYKELGEVDLDKASLKNEWEMYEHSLSKLMAAQGGEFKPMVTPVVDPTPHITAQIQSICIKMGCPQRIFMGSERGELASSQDDAAWNDRLRERQNNYLSPRLIEPFIDRLIALGVLPEPEAEDGYKIWWPDLESQGDGEKATIAQGWTTALAAFFDPTKELWTRMAPVDFWTQIMGKEEEEARKIVANAEKEREKLKAEKLEEEERQRQVADEQAAKDMERSVEAQRASQEVALESQVATTEEEIMAEAGLEPGEEEEVAANVFCPTGPGGGVKPDCSPKGGTGGATKVENTRAYADWLQKPNNAGPKDEYLSDLTKEIGYAVKPAAVSKTKMDALIADGHLELFRGAPPDRLEQLRKGDIYMARGVYGAGVYAASGFGAMEAAQQYKPKDGLIMRLALAPDAKTVDYFDLKREMRAKQRAMKEAAGDDPAKLREAELLTSDISRYAVSKGYDAILGGNSYLTLLNISKVTVQEEYVQEGAR
jgi:hypothetical protein